MKIVLFGVLFLFLVLRSNIFFAYLRAKRSKSKYGSFQKKICPRFPIVFVTGILGVKLFDPVHQAYVWGGPKEIFFRNPQHGGYALDSEIPLVANEHLFSFPVIPHLLEAPITWEMKITLEQTLGYQENRDLFFLNYDWRQSYRELAPALTQEIERIQRFFGHEQKILLIGQSMANLGIRYFLNNTSDHLRESIAKWYCFGPPWHGTYNALKLLEEGFYPATKTFYGFQFRDIFTYPCCFQLLPQHFQLLTPDGNSIENIDLYQSQCWFDYNIAGIVEQNLSPQEVAHLQEALDDAKIFTQEVHQNSWKHQVPQVWFASDNNDATVAAIFDQGKVIVDPLHIRKHYPKLVEKALAMGDDHIPLSHLTASPCGPIVRDYNYIPFGESYLLIGKPVDHRALINYYRPNITALLQDIAYTRSSV